MWKADFHRLGSEETRCITKMLLDHISGGESLSVYRDFIKATLCTNISHTNLGTLTDQTLARFYQADDDKLPPKWCSIGDPGVLAKIEELLSLRIVIARVATLNGWSKISDTRAFDTIFKRPAKRAFFFALCKEAAKWCLYVSTRNFHLHYTPSISECLFMSCSVVLSGCYHRDTARLLESSVMEHTCSEECSDLYKFCTSAPARAHLETQALFVTHIRSKLTSLNTRLPRHQTFARVATLRYKNEEVALSPRVFCLTSDCRMYLPNPSWTAYITDPGKAPKSRNPKTEKFPSVAVPVETIKAKKRGATGCASCRDIPKYKGSMSSNGPQIPYRTPWNTFCLLKALNIHTEEHVKSVLDACTMTSCFFDIESCQERAKTTAGNEDVSVDMPFLSDMAAPREVLHLQRAIRIGVMDGWDVAESAEPEILSITPERPTAEQLFEDFTDSILHRRERAVYEKHRLLADLFGIVEVFKKHYLDFFRVEGLFTDYVDQDQDFGADIFSDDDDGSSKEDDYFPAKKRSKRKEEELTDSEILAKNLKKKNLEVMSSWRGSIPGKLEHNLTRLAQKFIIWSFAGERYDMVMASSAVLMRARSLGIKNASMIREGSSVRSIKFDSILFADVKRLLAPGASLASLRALAALEPDKHAFPWSKLTSDLQFLDKTELPSDPQEWKSDLNGEVPTQERVDQIRALYTSKGFKTNSEFLNFYLSEDTKMTAFGTLKLLNVYFVLFHLHPVDSCRITISSLAATASQTYLFRQKAPSMWSLNNSAMFAVLKRGCRGGINVVSKAAAGKHCSFEDFISLYKRQSKLAGFYDDVPSSAVEANLRAINGHMFPFEPRPSNFLSYADANSLYSGSGE